MNLKLPSIATTIIGAILGVIVALNDQVFHFGPPWQVGINVALVVIGMLGISIISGPQFQAAVHLPQATCAAIASVLAAVQLILAQAGLDPSLRTVLQALLVVGATLGFGPTLGRAARVAAAEHAQARRGVGA